MTLEERERLFAKQKQERGWSDDELWSLDKTIALFILPRLKRFKEIENGYPDCLSLEEWNKILNKMINSFNIYVSDKDDYIPIGISDEAQEGFELFGKYFTNLWF